MPPDRNKVSLYQGVMILGGFFFLIGTINCGDKYIHGNIEYIFAYDVGRWSGGLALGGFAIFLLGYWGLRIACRIK